MTLTELWTAYKNAREGSLRSWKTVEGHAGHLLRILGPDREVASLSLIDIDTYRAHRRRERTQSGELTKPATRNHELSTLRTMLNFAVSRGMVAIGPIKSVGREREDNIRQTFLTAEEVDKLLLECTWWLKPMVIVGFWTGMRREEVRLLRWDQVVEDGTIVVLGQKNTKTGERRRVPLADESQEALRAHPRFGDYVFTNPDSANAPAARTPFGKATVDEAFRGAVKRTGLKGVAGESIPRFHDLRRSFVVWCRRNDIAETVIMKMTGHKTLQGFQRYNILTSDDVAAAAVKLTRKKKKAS